jgi:fibronectin-binding autotransporter adhesin
MFRPLKFLVNCAVFAMAYTQVLGQTWNVNSAGMWTNGGNWTPTTVPSGVDSIAVLGAVPSQVRNVTNDVAITNGIIIFDNDLTYRVVSSNGGAFYFDVSSGSAQLLISNANGNSAHTFLAPITLLDSLIITNLSTSVFTIGGGWDVTNSGNSITVGGSGSVTISNRITGAGEFNKVDSAVLQLWGTNDYTGRTLVSGGTLVGNTVSLQGTVTNNATIILRNTSAGTNSMTTLAGTGDLIISNTTGITTYFTNTVTYSGSTRIQSGNLLLTNALGGITNSSGFLIDKTTTLSLVNDTAANTDRIKDTAAITLRGGTLFVSAGTETVGVITGLIAQSTINITNSAVLTASSLIRDNRSTLNFIGNGTNVFTTAPTLNDGVLAYATVNGRDFATHDGNGTGIRVYTNYVTSFSGVATENVISTGAVQTVASSMTQNSLVLGTNLIIGTGNTLTLESGGLILTRQGSSITNGTLDFGSAEGVIFANLSTSTVFSVISGSAGLTKGGDGAVILQGANTLTGPLTVNAGTLILTNGGVLNLSSNVNVQGGFLRLRGGTLTATSLIASNGLFNLDYGTLTTSAGFISTTNTFNMASVAGQTATWNINGGTNTLSSALTISSVAGSTGNLAVAGSGTLLTVNSLTLGSSGAGNSIFVTNGAKVELVASGGSFNMGSSAGAISNTAIISGAGSEVNVTTGGDLVVGDGSTFNFLMISNGGMASVNDDTSIGLNCASNRMVITGSGTIYTNTGGNSLLAVGNGGDFNQLLIEKGGFAYVNQVTYVGVGSSNQMIITDSGSQLIANNNLNVGNGGGACFNELLITNGGKMTITGIASIGTANSSTGNVVIVTGANSLLQASGGSAILAVGSNATSKGEDGHVLVLDNGTLQAGTLISGFNGSGTISNRGGVYQFTANTPTITTNAIDSIILTNGTISFKNVTAANITNANVGRITHQGNNSWMLNNSTSFNFASYTFGTNNGNLYQHLIMENSGTRLNFTNVTLNTGGVWTFSNTTATVAGLLTNNAGTVKIVSTNGASTTATFERGLVISGAGDGSGAIQNRNATNTITGPITLMGASTISSASGKLTVDSVITNGGNTLTVNGAGNVTLAGPISGTGGLAINGGGTVTISNSSVNTFSGATTVTNSAVTLSKAGALGSTSGITLSASGTLLLDGGAIDRINNSASVTMDGGAITLNDLSETVGTMTMASNSTITFNFNGSAGDLTFASGSYTAGTLTIDGWFQANLGGEDKLYFTNDPGSTFLANITFTGYAAGARRLSSGEIVPTSVPEPGTVIASLILGGMGMGHLLRKRKSPPVAATVDKNPK